MLSMIRHGAAGSAPPLVIAHGLFGSGRNWGVLARRLSDRGPVVAVDMRNHGDSPHDPDHSYPALSSDLAEVAEACGAPVDCVGHSMGGKAAMMLALSRPDIVRRLIVADIAPVAYNHSQADLVAALRGVDLTGVASRGDADAQLASSVPDPAVRGFLLQSLDVPARRWRLNLDALEDQMERIVGWPADAGGRFDGPSLFLTGGASDYVRRQHRAVISALFPSAQFAEIAGAGHWLHAEKPRDTEAAIRSFLDLGSDDEA